MRRIPLLSAVLISAALVFAQTPKPLSAFEQELVSSEKQFVRAFEDKNVAYVNQAVSDDFKGIGTNGDFVEKGDLVGDAQEGRPKDMRVYDLRVIRLDAGCAVVAYNTITPGARPRYRHVSDTWTKEGGQWKLRFQQTTPNLWSATDLD
ncbi:MAG: nuclear transport factor 2 family protein [Terriglobales bacterium]